MWEISNSDQILTVLYSIVMGFGACMFYDIFRAYRAASDCSKISVFFQDIVFWLTQSVCFFLFFFVRTNGEIRGYVLLISAAAFFVCRITLSVVLFKILKRIAALIVRAVKEIKRKTEAFCAFLSDKFEIFCKSAAHLPKVSIKNQKTLEK